MGSHMAECGGTGCCSRWLSVGAGLAMPCVPLIEQSFKCMMCFRCCSLHVNGTLAVLADSCFFVFGWRFGACWAVQIAI